MKTFIAATERVQTAEVALVYQIIPLIDRFNELFTNIVVESEKTYHPIVRHAARLASKTLDKYYTLTDEAEPYRIGMGKSFVH
jgi:hypothetical protein